MECCENCKYYYKDFGMPCCKRNDMTEEHPDEEKCGDYERSEEEWIEIDIDI